MYKSKIAHFNSPTVVENFIENPDGSITKRALVLVEGEQTDSKKRKHIFSKERIRRIVQNTNSAFKNNANIPMFKEHQKNIDNMIGNVTSTFEARIITPEDLTKTASPDLIGKLGVFCDGLVIKAQDVVEKVKSGLAKELSPGIDIINDCIKEISVVAQPAIQGMAMYSMGEMNGMKTLTFDDYDKCMEDCEEDREEYDELCEKFYKVMCDIKSATEEDLQGQDPMELIGQAFDDFNVELQDLFMGDMMEDDGEEEDDPYGEKPNPYSMTQGSQTESPYSLFADDNADFAVPGMGRITKVAKSYQRGLGMMGRASGQAFKGKFGRAGAVVKKYFTTPLAHDLATHRVSKRGVNWGRVGKAGASAIGAGVLGYGAMKAGSNVTGIGKKKEKNYFNFKF